MTASTAHAAALCAGLVVGLFVAGCQAKCDIASAKYESDRRYESYRSWVDSTDAAIHKDLATPIEGFDDPLRLNP